MSGLPLPGLGVGEGFGVGEGVGVGSTLGAGVGAGAGVGTGFGFGFGFGVGAGVGAAFGVAGAAAGAATFALVEAGFVDFGVLVGAGVAVAWEAGTTRATASCSARLTGTACGPTRSTAAVKPLWGSDGAGTAGVETKAMTPPNTNPTMMPTIDWRDFDST